MVLFVCVDLILLLIVAFKIGIISVFKNIIEYSIMIGIFVQLFKKINIIVNKKGFLQIWLSKV